MSYNIEYAISNQFTEIDNGVLIFNTLMEKIKDEYGSPIFFNWFSGVAFKSFTNNVLTITTPSKFVREWIISNYFTKICKIIEQFNAVKRIDIIVHDNTSSLSASVDRNISSDQQYKSQNFIYNFDNQHTFSNFIVGSSNKVACAASQNIAGIGTNAQRCGTAQYNMLFIHSAVGMGKTHLLKAIGSAINKSHPAEAIGYLSAERFMHCYMMAVRKNELIVFKEKLRSLDVLLFDDLQFICDKSSTQKEFANTINALIESNKKIIIACDRSPYDLEIDPRTKSIIASGVVAEIQRADFDLRLRMLENKRNSMQISVEDDVLHYIATNVSSNMRELEGALNKLVTFCNLNEVKMSIDICRNTLKDCIKAHEHEISVGKLIQVVADLNGVSKNEILSKSRLSKLVYLRQMVAYIAKMITKSSLNEIGKNLGGKDHATVIYYIKQFEQKIERNQSITRDVENIKKIVMEHVA